MKKKENTQGGAANTIIKTAALILVPLIIAAAEWLYHRNEAAVLRDAVFALFGTGAVLFLMEQENLSGQGWLRETNLLRKFIFFTLGGLLCTVLFPLLPVTGWPLPVIVVFLSFYAGSVIGIVLNAFFVCVAVSLAGADYSVFLLYFVSGTISIILFRKLDEEYKITIPIFLSGMILFLMTTAEIILTSTEKITAEFFMIPCINIFITTIFYLVVLKYFSYRVIHKYRDKYMKIADPEYPLVLALKGRSKDDYYNAVHCAYFGERIADAIHCNKPLVKAGSYYHRLSAYCTEEKEEAYRHMMEEEGFPPDLQELLMEYQQKKYRKKEAVVIYFADNVISSILYCFHKHADMELNYGQIIGSIFDKKIISGIFNESEITMAELAVMKKIFMEEKLYYDFLR